MKMKLKLVAPFLRELHRGALKPEGKRDRREGLADKDLRLIALDNVGKLALKISSEERRLRHRRAMETGRRNAAEGKRRGLGGSLRRHPCTQIRIDRCRRWVRRSLARHIARKLLLQRQDRVVIKRAEPGDSLLRRLTVDEIVCGRIDRRCNRHGLFLFVFV